MRVGCKVGFHQAEPVGCPAHAVRRKLVGMTRCVGLVDVIRRRALEAFDLPLGQGPSDVLI